MEKQIHQGRNVKRFREMLGIKQEALALELGDDWSQKKISLLEAKETIEPDLLEQVAKVLKVPKEAIENFDEEKAVNIISNTFTDNNYSAVGYIEHYNPTVNPLEKYIEAVEEIKNLYERLLSAEREKNELLQGMMKERTQSRHEKS
jgi:transcriptional regulator with XRE-family HTH domain